VSAAVVEVLAHPPPPRLLHSLAETAELLSVTPRYVQDLVYSGQLPSVRLGRRRLVAHVDLEEFVDSLRAAASIEVER
jgi:excisionase family DNA binding protein